MSASPLADLSRLCVHTITTKPWSIEEAMDRYADAGIGGITVWRQWLEGRNPETVGEELRKRDLEIVSLCRGGFFPDPDGEKRRIAIEDNRRAIDSAEAIGAPLVVLVLTLRIRPVSLDRLFWTLCVPVVPLVYLWDGMVSHLRTYSVAELSALHGAFDNEYTWECGVLPVSETGQGVSYLLGYKLALRPGCRQV